MLRFRIALATMITALLLVFAIGAIPAAVEAIANGGRPTLGFDGYGGLEATTRDLILSLLVATMIGAGAFIGAYVRNPIRRPGLPWLLMAAISSIAMTVVVGLAVEFALPTSDLPVDDLRRRTLEIAMCMSSSALATWFVFAIWGRRVSASA